MGKFLFRVAAWAAIIFMVVALILEQADIEIDTNTIAVQASKALGRDITFDDGAKVTFYPTLGIDVTNLKISNAPDMTDAYFLEAKQATIGVRLLSLLSGSPEISEFVLQNPDIILERNAQGEVNWTLGTSDDESGTKEKARGTFTDKVNDLKLGNVRISEGQITYRRPGKSRITLRDANLTLSISSLYQPSSAKGSFVYNDEPVQLDLDISTLANLREGGNASVEISAVFVETDIVAQLQVSSKDKLAYSGPLSLDTPSIRRVLNWLGRPISSEYGIENLNLSGNATGDHNSINFEQANLAFDQISGQGSIGANWGTARTKLSGDLTLERLDLRPYVTAPERLEGAGVSPWSREKLNFSNLRAFDMDFSVTTQKFLIREFDIDNTAVDFTIKNGLLDAKLNSMVLYEGTGSGNLTLDATRSTPRLSASFRLTNMTARRFLTDAIRLDRLDGIGDLSFNLTSRGATQYDLMKGLDGEGTYKVRDGSIIGFDFLKFAYKIGVFATGGYKPSEDGVDRTAFTAFEADFNVRNGVVTTDDISLLSPLFRLSGNGTINLPPQTLDIKLNPRLVASLKGQGGDRDKQGLGIPLKYSGTFDNARLGLDPGQGARDRAEQEVKDRARDLLGDDKGEDGDDTPLGALEGIFGGRKKGD